MKNLVLIFLIVFSQAVFARGHGGNGGGHVHVNGYYRHDGTYVQPHMRTAPDAIKTNNFSYQGNINPYTGKVGTNPDNSLNYGHRGYYQSSGYVGNNYSLPIPAPHYQIQGSTNSLHNTKSVADYID